MFSYVIEVFVWSFAIYGFSNFIKENFWEFIDFVGKASCFICKKCVKFVAKKNR